MSGRPEDLAEGELARGSHEHLEQLEASAPEDPALAKRFAALPLVRAPAGWQAGVLAQLPEDPPPRPGGETTSEQAPSSPAAPAAVANAGPSRAGRSKARARRWAASAAAAVAFSAGLVVWRQAGEQERAPDELGEPKLSLRPAGSTRAATAPGRAALGDTLRIEVSGPADSVLRIYRNEREVVLECPSASSQCLAGTRELAAELTLSVPGSYRAVVQRPASRVSPPTGRLDGDLARCQCETRISSPVVAQ